MLYRFQLQNINKIHNIFYIDNEKWFAKLYDLIIINNLLKPVLYGWMSDSWEMEDHVYRNLYSDDDLQSLALIVGSGFL